MAVCTYGRKQRKKLRKKQTAVVGFGRIVPVNGASNTDNTNLFE